MTEAAEVLARHVSPDGQLTLVVERHKKADDALIIIGFPDGGGWHFHPTEQEALRIVDAVLADQVVIMQWTSLERSVTELMDDLALEIGTGADDVSYRFRLWSREVSFEDLVEGKVPHTPLSELWNWRI